MAIHRLPSGRRNLLIVMVWGLLATIGHPSMGAARDLVLGSISNEPNDEMRDWMPFASYLGSALAPDGISRGRIIIADSSKRMAELLSAGQVDLYIDSPIVTLLVSELSGSRLMARRWKGGKATYKSVIIVRQDSGITNLRDLRGKRIAYQERYSTTGYLLPHLALLEAGLDLFEIPQFDYPMPPNKLAYVFSQKDENTLAWILRGHVDAGATSDSHFEKTGKQLGLAVIYESPEIPRHIVSYRRDLADPLAQRIRDVLLTMHTTIEGRRVLESFEHTTRFDEISENMAARLDKYRAQIGALGTLR
jgi:phosphonate transport system substrate-binding protein